MKQKVLIKDRFVKGAIARFTVDDRHEATAVVKTELSKYLADDDFISWQYLDENDPLEKDAPRIAYIMNKYCHEPSDIMALVSPIRK
jgi:hypothetical protein